MRKTVMLVAVTVVAGITVTGCGGSHATAHPQALASVSPKASHVSSSGDKTACLLWHKSMDAVESETETITSWAASTNQAVAESSDSAFKRDAVAAVNDAKAERFGQMAQDERSTVNDCAADGVSIYGS